MDAPVNATPQDAAQPAGQGLMDRSKERAPSFKAPDVKALIPQGMEDAVQRTVAAGMKVMYAPQMRDELRKEVNSQTPVPQKLAMGITGLLAILDQQSKGQIPIAAMFPAEMLLLGEFAGLLDKAGQKVTQADYNQAAVMMLGLLGEKLGMNKDQVMEAVGKGVQGVHGDMEEGEPADAEQGPGESAGPMGGPAQPGPMMGG